ncbi:ATP-binding protein [Thalassoglobus sp. JC818]|uniref:ATP-binding protein n=1 Tax=Thalassoglobus sp. JC818 TaxID=3232136 RepID=UPI003458B86F
MKREPEQLIHGLLVRYFGVLSLVAALLLLDQAVVQPLLLQLNGLGPVINLAGRQRMLSQRMTKAVLAIAHDSDQQGERTAELTESLSRWQEVHDGLQFGNESLQLQGTNVPHIQAALRELDSHVRAISELVTKVIQSSNANNDDVRQILIHEKEFLTRMDSIVGMFEEEAARQVARLRWLGMTATGVVLALMIGLARIIITPASNFIRSQFCQLAASEERFRSLIERMNDGLVVFDEQGCVKYVNHRFAQIIERSPESILGKPLQKLLSGPDLRMFLQMLTNVLPAPDVARELKWELPEGQQCATLAACGRAHVDSVSQEASFLVVTDISELKRAEEELRQAHDALEVRVEERTQALTETNKALATEVRERQSAEERNRLLQAELAHTTRVTTLGQFATGLAHEINQPLGAIANYADLLMVQLDSNVSSPQTLNETAGRIHDSALRAGEIVRRMRSFLKPKPANKSEESINSLIDEVLDLCSPEIRSNQIEVVTDLTETQDFKVFVDSIQIQQVLVNLIHNSIQAMATTGPQRTLSIKTENHIQEVYVFVEDNGPGFPSNCQTAEIVPFQSTKPQGLGMGLSISHSLVTFHQGKLWLENVVPHGARVGFSLKVVQTVSADAHSNHLCR